MQIDDMPECGNETKPIKQSSNLSLCAVCSDKSSGFHYGVHACEGCKGFFRRMVTSSVSIDAVLHCTGTKKYKCEINSNSRSKCQRCRLQRCFLLGMTRHKTRLGRRTREFTQKLAKNKIVNNLSSILTDDQLFALIKKENKIFNSSNLEDEEPTEEKFPTPTCVKYKAKLYSEKYSALSNKSSRSDGNENNPTSDNSDLLSKCNTSNMKNDPLQNSTCEKLSMYSDVSKNQNKSKQSTNEFEQNSHPYSANSYSTTSSSCRSVGDNSQTENPPVVHNSIPTNEKISLCESIKQHSKELQLEKLFSQIRTFLSGTIDTNSYSEFRQYKGVIPSMLLYFNPTTIDTMEEFFRITVDTVTTIPNPLLFLTDLVQDLMEMCRRIHGFISNLPDFQVFLHSHLDERQKRRTIFHVLTFWMIRFLNLTENLLYNPRLTMKIPFSSLFQTPLKRFFENLLNIGKRVDILLTTEIDDSELSFISALIITFSSNIIQFVNCNPIDEPASKYQFLYSSLLYEYIYNEKFLQNIDCTEYRFRQICWLIKESQFQDENEIDFLFSRLNLVL